MSKIISTPKRRTIPTGEMPAAIRIIESIIIPVTGADEVPIDAARAVNVISRMVMKSKSILKS
jgi:hypothetical protein